MPGTSRNAGPAIEPKTNICDVNSGGPRMSSISAGRLPNQRRAWQSHRAMRLVTLAVLALLPMLLVSCGEEKVETGPELRPVRYQPVYAKGGTRVRTFSGVARAGMESNLSFKVAGTVERVAVKVGDRVDQGDLIATLDDSDYKLQVEEAQASLQQAQAQARNASSSYERVRGLYENRNASKNDLDQARSTAESAEAQVEAIEKRLELARLQVSYTELRAPVAGSIARVDVEANENVSAGRTVAVITSGSRLEVEVAVPEILIAQIREGDRVTVKFDALGDREIRARVTEVGVASTVLVTTFPVTVTLEENEADCRPGMAAEVAFRFVSSDQRERFVVPAFAVGEDREGRHVFVVKPGADNTGVVERRAVTVGEFTDDGLEVLDGLMEGDLLVTAG
ncbi:efflux RND transporter periplasmic adaptor subunit, partial [candidate division GN15 bacterium]|nr:efflux RND transporter periplasmic adaptor subunit [candidate division GN15 bacterium]